MQKKFPSSTKKAAILLTIAGAIYLFEGFFYAIYTIKSQSSTVIQTCYTVAQPQQTRVISLYRDYCTKLSQSLDGMWSILNMFQLVQKIPNKPTIFFTFSYWLYPNNKIVIHVQNTVKNEYSIRINYVSCLLEEVGKKNHYFSQKELNDLNFEIGITFNYTGKINYR